MRSKSKSGAPVHNVEAIEKLLAKDHKQLDELLGIVRAALESENSVETFETLLPLIFEALKDVFVKLLRNNGAGDEAQTRNFQLGNLDQTLFIFNTYKTWDSVPFCHSKTFTS